MLVRQIPLVFTRPNDTIAYSPGDVIGFANAEKLSRIGIPAEIRASEGSSQMLRFSLNGPVSVIGSVVVAFDAIQSAKVGLELWAFRQELKIQEDNTPFAPTLKDLTSLEAVIPLEEFPAAGKRIFQSRQANIMIPTIRDLWCVLVVKTPFTPKAGGEFLVSLVAEFDGF